MSEGVDVEESCIVVEKLLKVVADGSEVFAELPTDGGPEVVFAESVVAEGSTVVFV